MTGAGAATLALPNGVESRRVPMLLLAPTAVCYLLFFLVPLGLMLFRSVVQDGSFNPAPYAELFSTPLYLRVIWTTLKFSIITTGGCLLLGYPVAFLLTRTHGLARNFFLLMVLVPYWLDFIVRTYAWMILLGRFGMVNKSLMALGLVTDPRSLLGTDLAVGVGMIQVMLPLMILSLYAGMLRIDRDLLRAAEAHGAGAWQQFRRVFLPLSMPGVLAGSLLTFVNALGFYITPALLGGPKQTMISQTISMLASQLLDWPLASAASVLLLGVAMAILIGFNRYFGFERSFGGRA